MFFALGDRVFDENLFPTPPVRIESTANPIAAMPEKVFETSTPLGEQVTPPELKKESTDNKPSPSKSKKRKAWPKPILIKSENTGMRKILKIIIFMLLI